MGRRRQPSGTRRKQLPSAELAVLVAAAGDERACESHRRQIERNDVQMVIGVDQQLGAMPSRMPPRRGRVRARSRRSRRAPTTSAPRASCRPPRSPRARPACRAGCAATFVDLDAFLGESIELTTHRVELTVGRHEPAVACGTAAPTASAPPVRACSARARCSRACRRAVARIRLAPELRLLRGALPLLVHELRRVEPGSLLRLESHVRPRLVRMAGQQQPLARRGIANSGGERVGGTASTSNASALCYVSPRHVKEAS